MTKFIDGQIYAPYFKSKSERLEEINFSFFKKIFEKMKSFFSNLKFGEKTKYNIPLTDATLAEKKVSSVGYLHEWLIMDELLKCSKENMPFKIVVPQENEIPKRLKEYYEEFTVTLPKNQPADAVKFKDSVKRAEISAPKLAEKIMNDILSADDSIFFKEIIIKHVGGAGLGKHGGSEGGKADIEISVLKRDEKEASVLISASLKIGLDGFITLLTTNSNGFLNKILFPEEGWKNEQVIQRLLGIAEKHPELKQKVEEFNQKFAVAAMKAKEVASAKKIKNKELEKIIKEQQKIYAAEVFKLVYIDIFEFFYKKDKKFVNKNFLTAMGLESADTTYYTLVETVAKKKNQKPKFKFYFMSSKTSNSYKNLFGKFSEDFDIKFVQHGAGGKLLVTDKNSELFWESGIGYVYGGNYNQLYQQNFVDVVKKNLEPYIEIEND
jgi:hypothetical protein